ncbi:hypothetical protein Hanom_Chr14g01327711 [Helianthus anomalus]
MNLFLWRDERDFKEGERGFGLWNLEICFGFWVCKRLNRPPQTLTGFLFDVDFHLDCGLHVSIVDSSWTTPATPRNL